jgi:hypothetical protein
VRQTGEPADRLLPVRATYVPRWTWLLLPFGWLAFMIARGFTTELATGLVPFSQAGLARKRAQAWARLGWGVLGAVLLLVVLYRVAWPLALLGGCVLVALLSGLGLISAELHATGAVGAHLDPENGAVVLWGVHDRFKQAVESGQRPDPEVRYWQPQ